MGEKVEGWWDGKGKEGEKCGRGAGKYGSGLALMQGLVGAGHGGTARAVCGLQPSHSSSICRTETLSPKPSVPRAAC